MDATVSKPTVDSGRGAAWWTESWALFMKNPGMWLVFGVIFFIGSAVLSMVPVLGGLVVAVATQVIVGGWMLSARKLDSGGTLQPADLFLGFKEKLNPLLVLGAMALGASIIIMLVAGVMGGGAFIGMAMGGAARSTGGMMAGAGMMLLTLLVVMVLGFVFAMAFWYAPALIVFRDVAPVDAVKASWSATLTNVVPLLIYGVIWIVAAVIASIPLMLGWVLLLPLTMLGMYRSYIDLFEQPSAVPAAA
jgi:uncharacterized membrane protein